MTNVGAEPEGEPNPPLEVSQQLPEGPEVNLDGLPHASILPRATEQSIQLIRDNVPAELQQLPAWVASDRSPKQLKHGQIKSSKAPINPRTGDFAKSNDPATWGTIDQACECALRDERCFGVGVNLYGSEFVGLDLDHVIDKDARLLPKAEDLLDALPHTYTERSPSGDGLRLFYRGRKPAALTRSAIKDAFGPGTALEVYDGSSGARYLTTTGNAWWHGEPVPISAVIDDDLEPLVLLQPKAAGRPSALGRRPATNGRVHHDGDDDVQRARWGLIEAQVLQPDDGGYDGWWRVGVALHTLGDVGLDLWREWSTRSQHWDEAEILRKWPGMRGSSIASLFGMFDDRDPDWRRRFLARNGDVQPWRRATKAEEEAKAGVAVAAPAKDPLPTIKLLPGRLASITRQAEDALLQAEGLEPIYQRATELVHVVRLPERVVLRPGAEIAANTPILQPIAATWLVAQFEQAAKFIKFDARSQAWVPKDCPDRVAALYLQSAGNWRVPPLTAIVTAPTLRPDGTVLQTPGYDVATGIVFEPCGVDFPSVPEAPTPADAQAAVAELLEPVRHFLWASLHDRSVWLAAILTALVRALLSAAPMTVFDATVRASGKTLLAMLVAIIATGSEPSLMIHVDDDDEQRKRLFALLRRGVQVVCLDNIDRPLEGASLCVVLTSPVLEDRVLGESRTAAVSTCCTLLATGNNVHVLGDLTRRVLLCRIDPQVERPEERRFDFDPLEYARQHRPRLVCAALTLLRAHAVAGRPDEASTPFGSFEDWNRVVRAALVWAGEPDPVLGRQAVQEVDDEHAALAELLRRWHEHYGPRPQTIREAIGCCHPVLQQAVDLVVGDERQGQPKRLGERIAAARGRIFEGLRFVMEPGKAHGGVRRWRVEPVDCRAMPEGAP